MTADDFPCTISEAAFEFADDPDAIIAIASMWSSPQTRFYTKYTQLRQQRAHERALTKPFQESGYAIVPAHHHLDHPPYPMSILRDAQGAAPTLADVRQHPYLWSIDLRSGSGFADNATGIEVDEEQVDWDIEGDHDPQPKPGMHSPHEVHEIDLYYGALYCLNPAAAGLQLDPTVNTDDHWEPSTRIETLHTELIDASEPHPRDTTAAYRLIHGDGSYSDHAEVPPWTDTTLAILRLRTPTDAVAVHHAITHAPTNG